MALKNLHIRVSNEEYDFLCALAEELHCSQAAVIRKALFHTDMKAIVQNYRQRQGDAYLQRIVACGLDDSAAEKLEGIRANLQGGLSHFVKSGCTGQVGANIMVHSSFSFT